MFVKIENLGPAPIIVRDKFNDLHQLEVGERGDLSDQCKCA